MNTGKIYQGWILVLACSFSLQAGQILYTTGFEASEGYDGSLPLGVQRNWLIEGSGGNGLVTNFFEGFGQQGFIGYTPPTNTAAATAIWTPINFNPAMTRTRPSARWITVTADLVPTAVPTKAPSMTATA